MSHPTPFLLAGLGAHGRAVWCEQEIPRLHANRRARLVGVIDPDIATHAPAVSALGLRPHQCFTSIEKALEGTSAVFLIDATGFGQRASTMIPAMRAGLHVFAEKPVGGDLATSCRILHCARTHGRKAAVNFTNRFFRDKQSFEFHLHAPESGPCDYISSRFGWRVDQRPRMPSHGQLLEGSVHALSYLLALARSTAEFVTSHSWNPPWSPMIDGGSTNVFIEMVNGIRCQLEASWAVRATTNGWDREYLRAECAHGTLELTQGNLHFWQEDKPAHPTAHPRPKLSGEQWGHELLINQFIDWITGRRPDHPTSLEDSIHCMALLFAAIESARCGGHRCDVSALLAETLARTADS